jgi:hypothetical protein
MLKLYNEYLILLTYSHESTSWHLLKLILIHQESRCTEKLNIVFRAPFGEAGLHKKSQTVPNCLQNVQHTQ